MPSPVDKIYCLKCREKTANAGKPKKVTTANGRTMVQVKCEVCDTKKSQFVKQ